MKNRIYICIMSCVFIFFIMLLIGCDGSGKLPMIFGSRGDRFDPGAPGKGQGNLTVRVQEEENPDYGINGADIYIDDMTNYKEVTNSEGSAYIYNIDSGHHIMKITHPSYGGYGPTIILVNGGNEDTNINVSISMDDGDSYEGNDTWENAHDLTDDAAFSYGWYSTWGYDAYQGTFQATIHSEGNQDWYKIDLSSYYHDKIKVNLSNIPSGCNYDLELYKTDGNGSAVQSSYNEDNATENLEDDSWDYATYYIRVYPVGTVYDSSQEYTLSIVYYGGS